MTEQRYELDFTGQKLFIGIDVHKKSWKVTISSNQMTLKTFSMEPSAEQLAAYMQKHYPKGEYYSVYEAGFCGFWIDRELNRLGIKNIIVNPGDIPARNKERITKTDAIDSKKLSRELSNGTISSIYIPQEVQEELRSLCRLRQQITKAQVRLKNQIKGMLYFYGIEIPGNYEIKNWSGNFIKYLEAQKLKYNAGNDCIRISIEQIKMNQNRLNEIVKLLKQYVKEYKFEETIKNLCSVPGISFITAITLFTELMEVNRFNRLDNLCSYVGLVPSVMASGQKERTLGISKRYSKYLRNMLIESSWVAIRKDPALTMSYGELIKRMNKQKAIIKIARKLLNRVRYVWKNNCSYETAVVM